MTTFSDSKRLVRIDNAEEPNTALGSARRATSRQTGLQGSAASRSYALPGLQASGRIVFSSLFIMAGLGVGGVFGFHAYVHRDDPPLLVDALPAASQVPQPAILPLQVSSAGLDAAPQPGGPPFEPISARAVSRTMRHAAVAAASDKPATSESSDNPY
jgi:hypothetical protein